MNSSNSNSSGFDDDMSEYMQTFLDETEEQLDDLVETILLLETTSTNEAGLNEAFRLIHSIKGAAGMMGLEQITVLTHHLENRFERYRSETEQIDKQTMNLVLRCIDFLRHSTARLRDGETLADPTELLAELKQLELLAAKGDASGDDSEHVCPPAEANSEPESLAPPGDNITQVVVRFRAGLPLADLKAQLILNRMTGLGTLQSHSPSLDQVPDDFQIDQFEIWIETDANQDQLLAAADVDGVESVDFPAAAGKRAGTEIPADDGPVDDRAVQSTGETIAETGVISSGEPDSSDRSEPVDTPSLPVASKSQQTTESSGPAEVPAPEQARPKKAASKITESMRVDIDRLDNLMNLTGELVVNRARFVQISGGIGSSHRNTSTLNRIRNFCDSLRHTIDGLESEDNVPIDRNALALRLRSGLDLIDEHTENWERDRGYLEDFGDAIDQLSRVSQSLQKGVLDTRMVSVGPLFSRFKRVIRDLSVERGKRVNLVIQGETTELDKRMVDELGDPLVHLVRNSIDHGMETPEIRVASGKPEIGTISLEASHSGNNVYIIVRDDGSGIDVEKIRSKLVSNRVLSQKAADELSHDQALEYVWHPGFSTAKEVTDISGRGVGMDVVLTRIRRLNGSVEIQSTPQQGTQFTIRLPLTLAIINCLLVKLRGVVFSVSIEDVREIISLTETDIITVAGKQTFEVRDEFLPLVNIEDIFHWHNIDYGHDRSLLTELYDKMQDDSQDEPNESQQNTQVVILQSDGKAMGLRVDELLGSQDMVIKSLSDNLDSIRGLAGASILGDGTVCLMLDVGNVFDMANKVVVESESEELIQ